MNNTGPRCSTTAPCWFVSRARFDYLVLPSPFSRVLHDNGSRRPRSCCILLRLSLVAAPDRCPLTPVLRPRTSRTSARGTGGRIFFSQDRGLPHTRGLQRFDLCFLRQVHQPLDLDRRQIAERPLREIAQHQIAGFGPLQFDHRPSDPIEHAAHLALPAFSDGELDPGIRFFLADLPEFRGRGLPVVEKEARLDHFYLLFVKHALDLGQIGFGQFMLGMGDLEGEIPVIRHDQHAFGVVIQPAHGIDADLDPLQQILHRGPAFGVGHCRDKAHGFIQHNIRFRLMRIDEFAVDLDVVLGCVGLGAEFGHHLAVHAHPAFGD